MDKKGKDGGKNCYGTYIAWGRDRRFKGEGEISKEVPMMFVLLFTQNYFALIQKKIVEEGQNHQISHISIYQVLSFGRNFKSQKLN